MINETSTKDSNHARGSFLATIFYRSDCTIWTNVMNKSRGFTNNLPQRKPVMRGALLQSSLNTKRFIHLKSLAVHEVCDLIVDKKQLRWSKLRSFIKMFKPSWFAETKSDSGNFILNFYVEGLPVAQESSEHLYNKWLLVDEDASLSVALFPESLAVEEKTFQNYSRRIKSSSQL